MLLQQINQSLLTLVIFSCLGLFSRRNYHSGLFHHLYTGLSNGGRINDGCMVVRSVSFIVRRMPHPELRPACEVRLCHAFTASRRCPASTLTSAPGHISFNKLFLRKAIILFGPHYFMCVGDRLRLRHVVYSASRCRHPNRCKSARVITLLVELPYRHVRLPRGLRHC